MKSADSILVFGCGPLQRSIMRRARLRGLFVVGIDPDPMAAARDEADAFEVVGGQDFVRTVEVARQYGVKAVVTAATDKPLVVMARVAEALRLPFVSEETTMAATDKFLMKNRFISGGVPCARGFLLSKPEDAEGAAFPLILKPRDNSGSRGVTLCRDMDGLRASFVEAIGNSHLESVLAEEYITGPEYSVESIHIGDRTEVIQITEKHCTPPPYNVELGHIQPAVISSLSRNLYDEIVSATVKATRALGFRDCTSHTELKVSPDGVKVIETSPRLGGDYITSDLVPLSTGINIEDKQLDIALGLPVSLEGRRDSFSAVRFFSFPEGTLTRVGITRDEILSWSGVTACTFNLRPGDRIGPIKSSLSRYGEFIVTAPSRDLLLSYMEQYHDRILSNLTIE